MADGRAEERRRRLALWEQLHREGSPRGIVPLRLRELGLYGGAQGIWVDKARTKALTPDGTGVTVSLLHTGLAYADDLAEDGVLYHYPRTRRPPWRDLAEVAATKAASHLGLPVFVITSPSPKAPVRDVQLSWVEEWNDVVGLFLVTFGEAPPQHLPVPPAEESPFELVERRQGVMSEVFVRRGQHRFKFRLLERYGPVCAVCDLDVLEVLDAAHLRPKRESGTDDPRNGLVLCAVHHRAFDAGLFAFEPATLALRYRPQGPDAAELRVSRTDLTHLRLRPHPEAVQWLWREWTARHTETAPARTTG